MSDDTGGPAGVGAGAAAHVGVGDPVAPFRRYLLVLAALGVIGTASELAMLRHWTTTVQLVPWFALGAVAVAVAVLWFVPTAAAVRLARVLAVAVAMAAVFGMWEHVRGNYDAGPLDRRYSATWDGLSATSKWWKAVTKGVGPSPMLAPAVLVQASLCVLFATRRHPASARAAGEPAAAA